MGRKGCFFRRYPYIKSSNVILYSNYKKKSLLQYLNKYGFIVFNSSKELKNKINAYSVENIYAALKKLKLLKPIAKEQDFKTGKVTYSDSRYGAFFISAEQFKETVKDQGLFELVELLHKELRKIYDISINDYTFPFTFLHSLKDDKDLQKYHMDFQESIGNCKTEVYPFSVIFAFKDNTPFRYLQGSHVYRGVFPTDKPLVKKMIERLVYLNFGQYIIFHPYLVHSGMPHQRANTRYHVYCDIVEKFDRSKEEYNNNVFIDIDENKSLFVETDEKRLNSLSNLKPMKLKRPNNLEKYHKLT